MGISERRPPSEQSFDRQGASTEVSINTILVRASPLIGIGFATGIGEAVGTSPLWPVLAGSTVLALATTRVGRRGIRTALAWTLQKLEQVED